MRFSDSFVDDLLEERKKVADFLGRCHATINHPIAKCPKEYDNRPKLSFGEDRQICCQGSTGQFTRLRYNLLQRLAASPTGVLEVLDLCEFDDALQLKPLWNLDDIPKEGSLRNFASRINRDLAKYGMPWAVSYSDEHKRFILRFLPNPQATRRKYHPYLPEKLFFQNSVTPCNTVFRIVHFSDKPSTPHNPPSKHAVLE
ncbi:MAG: hypothetical protein FWC50_12140 [Planctomycetaceae bacterium]|nr:hypothetical protein [Planctomycetaceae bacterium]